MLTCVEEDKIKMAEINYLCVHKDYRIKNLAPILISEVQEESILKTNGKLFILQDVIYPHLFAEPLIITDHSIRKNSLKLSSQVLALTKL